jgi:Zn finger protein HypA/HybF involved in hydrogenase expression
MVNKPSDIVCNHCGQTTAFDKIPVKENGVESCGNCGSEDVELSSIRALKDLWMKD